MINGGTIMSYLDLDTSKYRAGMASAVAQAGILGDSNASAAMKLRGLGAAASTVGTMLSIGITAPVIGMSIAAGKSAIDFESAFAGVRKTVDATDTEFANLRQSLIDMSETIPTAKEDLAGIMEIAGQLGVSNSNLENFTRTIADLGESTNLSGQDAATMLAQFANVTGMDLSNIDRLGSVIVDLGNNAATTERDIATMAQRLAGMAQQVNLTEAQTMGLSATMAELGIEAEAGGSGMSRTMANMQKAVLGGGKDLKAFATVAGMSADAFAASFQGNPIDALNAFVGGLASAKASGDDVYAMLDGLELSDVRITDVLLRMSGAQGSLTENINRANGAWEANNALTNEAAKRYATTESKLKLAKKQY